MKKQKSINDLALSAMFLALAIVLPFMTGQIPEIGNMLCPMHIPILLCGFVCSAPWGMAVGAVAPLIRSVLFGKPILFPSAVSMAFELAAYGLMTGILYRVFPKKKGYIYCSLIIAMVIGRIVWGIVQFACMGLDASKFGFSAFWAGAVVNALPGIVLQIVLIPVIVMLIKKIKPDRI